MRRSLRNLSELIRFCYPQKTSGNLKCSDTSGAKQINSLKFASFQMKLGGYPLVRLKAERKIYHKKWVISIIPKGLRLSLRLKIYVLI